METTVVRRGDEYILNGAKTWISGVGLAEWYLTFATLDRAKGAEGCLRLRRGARVSGLQRAADPQQARRSGPRRWASSCSKTAGCRRRTWSAGKVRGSRSRCARSRTGASPWRAARSGSPRAVSTRPWVTRGSGSCQGQPIARYQLVQAKIADMVLGIESARYPDLSTRVAEGAGRAPRARGSRRIAKLYASEMAFRVASDAVQIHGAYGASEEYVVGRFLRDAKFLAGRGGRERHPPRPGRRVRSRPPRGPAVADLRGAGYGCGPVPPAFRISTLFTRAEDIASARTIDIC